MFNFLHTFHPTSIIFSQGFIQIHWYGVLIVLGMILAIGIAVKLGKYYSLEKDLVFDLSFYLILFGIIGARIYDVCLEWQYYLQYPLDVFKIWNGGLAIHGAIIAGVIVVWVFAVKFERTAPATDLSPRLVSLPAGRQASQERGARETSFVQRMACFFRETSIKDCFASLAMTKSAMTKARERFWLLTAIVVPGLSLALGIGRWGNYFNQEIFGLPTDLPWGIPIDLMHRPFGYISAEYFQPTFLYESLGSFFIFAVLILMHVYIIKNKKFSTTNYQLLTISYLVMYSILRFSLEFIRIDYAPEALGLRWPQVTSLAIIVFCILLLVLPKIKKRGNL